MKKSKLLAGAIAISMSVSMVSLAACKQDSAALNNNAEYGGIAGTVIENPAEAYGYTAVTAVRILGNTANVQAVGIGNTVSTAKTVLAASHHEQEYHDRYYYRDDYKNRHDGWNHYGEEESGEPAEVPDENVDERVDENANENVNENVDESAVKEQTEKFNEYFTALEYFLNDEPVTTAVTENTDTEYAEYETKLEISGKDFEGNEVVSVMYYTETLKKLKDKGGEIKEEYVLEGVMPVGGADYILRGERSYEEDGRENETEFELIAYSPEDRGTYVEVKQETEEEDGETECEYVYGVYSAGRLVEETSIKFETEVKGGKQETEYELEFRGGESRGKYKIKREIVGDRTEISVRYEIDGKSGRFFILSAVDESGEEIFEYYYSDNTVGVYRR